MRTCVLCEGPRCRSPLPMPLALRKRTQSETLHAGSKGPSYPQLRALSPLVGRFMQPWRNKCRSIFVYLKTARSGWCVAGQPWRSTGETNVLSDTFAEVFTYVSGTISHLAVAHTSICVPATGNWYLGQF